MSAAYRPKGIATIGQRLKIERGRLGLSQPAMATLAGVTKGALVKWEKDTAAPNALALAAFAAAGADVLYIVTGVPKPTKQEAFAMFAETAVRQAMLPLDPVDRVRILLDVLAGEWSA